MPLFAVTYRYSDDLEARDAFRPAHRAFLGGLDEVLLTGPVAEPDGALILVAAPSSADVNARLAEDPFVVEGVVVERTVRPYRPVGGSALAAFAAHVDA